MQKKTKREAPLEIGNTARADRAQDQAECDSSGSLDQVRDILLGPIAQHLEQKLNQLEQRIEQSMQEFSEKTSARIDALEKRLDKGFEGERDRHSKAAEQLEQLSSTLNGRLDTEVKQLRGELVDRASLASAFSEVAMRLSGEDLAIDPSAADSEIDAALANLEGS